MSNPRPRPITVLRASPTGILCVCAPVALLVSLATVGTMGQASPTFSVNDVSLNEGTGGLAMVEFTVSLANGNGTESSVGIFTNNGTATGGGLRKPVQSAGPITLGDGPSSPYGILFNVAGVTGPLVSAALLLESLKHTSPQDLDMLLVAPDGKSMVVQSDTGPANNPNTISYILADYNPLIGNSLLGGSYGPTSRSPADVFPAPAPAGPYADAAPAGTATLDGTFIGIDPNGTWRLFINDDSPGGTGTLNRVSLFVDEPEPGTDFTHVGGRLAFPPGTTEQKVRVWVNGDTVTEADETFLFELAAPVNGVVGDAQGIATIRNGGGGSGGLPPTTTNDAYQTAVDVPLQVPAPGVLANDMTNLGGPMSAQIVTQPTFGLLTLASDGSLKYIPGPNFVGTDSFTYRAVNTVGQGNIATVQINVAGGTGGAPTAVDDAFTCFQNGFVGAGPSHGGPLRNDINPSDGGMSALLVTGPSNGTLTLQPTGQFLYRPNQDFVGTDTFTYRATNQFGESNVGTVTITVQSSLPPPTNLRVDDIRFVGIDQRRMRLRFDYAMPEPNGFELAGGTQPGETLAVVPTGSPYSIFEFIAPGGSYFIRTHAIVGADRSGASNEVPLHVNTTVTPSAPVNLLGLADGGVLTLKWDNTFGGGIPTNTFLRVTGDASVTLPLGLTDTFSYPAVPAGTYNFEVLNGNAGVSMPSNKVTLTFPGTCAPPQVPEDFLVYTTGNRVDAIWELPGAGPAPTGFELDVQSPIFTGKVPVAQRSIGATVPSGNYYWRVRSINSCGSSAWTHFQQTLVGG